MASQLGPLLRSRREQLGLSKREAARRVGISAGYLLALEEGHNPSTGRAPVPSPPILSALGRVLDVEMEMLLEAVGTPVSSSAHVLLYQTGSRLRSALPSVQAFYGDRVQEWVEVLDPRLSADRRSPPGVEVVSGLPATRGVGRTGRGFDRSRAVEAICAAIAGRRLPGDRLGVLVSSSSAVLRDAQDMTALLESEATWEDDLGSALTGALGVRPVANICVYREADLQELASGLDSLATLLSLLQTHPHVALQHRETITTGPAATERILGPMRPAGISSDTWETLARAAAIGLARNTTP